MAGGSAVNPGLATMSGVFGRAVARGVKGWIKNLVADGSDDAELRALSTHEFFFRPQPINEQLDVQYSKVTPLGMSHSYHIYTSTGNVSWSFELFQNALMILREIGADKNRSTALTKPAKDRPPAIERGWKEGGKSDMATISVMMEDSRRFLHALAYPPRVLDGVAEAPPECVLCIPGVMTAVCHMMSCAATYEQFDIEGNLRQWRAQVVFEESPRGRLNMDDVLLRGTQRGPSE
jgi:hypothetical protein